jgi:hypothetical protein
MRRGEEVRDFGSLNFLFKIVSSNSFPGKEIVLEIGFHCAEVEEVMQCQVFGG